MGLKEAANRLGICPTTLKVHRYFLHTKHRVPFLAGFGFSQCIACSQPEAWLDMHQDLQ